MGKSISFLKNYLANLRFLPAKPRVLARVCGNYFRILALRQPALRVVTVAINYACQLSCRHCSAEELKKEEGIEKRLGPEDYSRIFKEAAICGAINIHFTGGEPLLDQDFYRIAALADRRKNILSLVSNGLLLARESRNLKKAGFDLVIVSIDSPIAKVHDEIRGQAGAHQKAWEGVESAREAGLAVMIAMVATHENLNNAEIEEQIALCRKKNLVLQLLPVRPVGKLQNKAAVLLNAEDQQKLSGFNSLPDVRWDGRSSYLSSRCLAARERLYIDCQGNVFPCDFIQRSFGNVKEESLGKIWKRMLTVSPYNRKNPRCLSAFEQEFVSHV